MSILDDAEYDREKFCLGKLCKRGHDWNGTAQSLRRRKKSTCLDCERGRIKDKEQVRIKKREWYERNRDRTLAVNAVYRKAHKEECKAITKRWTEQNKEAIFIVQKAWREKNKERLSQKQKAYRAANPEECRQADAAKYIRCRERCRARSKDYRQTDRGRTLERLARHRKRARLRNASTHAPTFEEIATLREKCSHQCVYCDSRESLSLDHFIPLCFGGSHCIGNLLIACTSCNSSTPAILTIGFRPVQRLARSGGKGSSNYWARLRKPMPRYHCFSRLRVERRENDRRRSPEQKLQLPQLCLLAALC